MSAPIAIGDVLADKYRVERVLGAGGMGIVVAATHMQLGEQVAIKFLLPDALKEEGVVARFLREAQAAAKIRSEHIARAYDVGTLQSGAPYIVMEYLDGSDLEALVTKHGPFPIDIVAEYGLQVCEALAAAHAAGIVHRDLKPGNIFVTTRSDGSPVVKVIDFGISKVVAGAESALNATKTTEIRGSPLYMAPEQMRRSRDVDARSDIWSLGVTLYNLLTGSHPFYSESLMELCSMVFHDNPEPLRAKRPEVPPRLELVVFRCLQKDPAQRFENVAELAVALAEFAPVAARISAERAQRTLRAADLSGRASLPSVTSVGGRIATEEAAAQSNSRARPSSSGQSTPNQTIKTWGSASPSTARRSGLYTAGLISVVTAAACVVLAMLLRWGAGAPASSPLAVTVSSTGEVQPAPTFPLTTPAAPVVQPAMPLNPSAPSADAVVAPSVSPEPKGSDAQAASIAPAKPPSIGAPLSRKADKPQVPPTSTTPKSDLFKTRR